MILRVHKLNENIQQRNTNSEQKLRDLPLIYHNTMYIVLWKDSYVDMHGCIEGSRDEIRKT